MNPFELTALAILLAGAVTLVLLAVAWDVIDRRPVDPPQPPDPKPPEIYRGQHRDWGPTIRIRPPK